MYHALLVGGDKGAALALEAALGPRGHGSAAGLLVAVVHVADRKGALFAVATRAPDVLVVDVAVRQWRDVIAAARRKKTAYVLIVGPDENMLAEFAGEIGANGCLARPFSSAALENQIRYWLAPRPSAPEKDRHDT